MFFNICIALYTISEYFHIRLIRAGQNTPCSILSRSQNQNTPNCRIARLYLLLRTCLCATHCTRTNLVDVIRSKVRLYSIDR